MRCSEGPSTALDESGRLSTGGLQCDMTLSRPPRIWTFKHSQGSRATPECCSCCGEATQYCRLNSAVWEV